jgi:hypothetical protein
MRDIIVPVLKQAMAMGSLVVALSYGSGISSQNDVGPAGEDFVYSTTNTTAWLDAAHKLSTGADIGGVAVSSIGSWGSTVHVHYTSFGDAETRPGFNKVLRAASVANVALFEYKYDTGFVIVDGLTSKSGGWGSGNTNFADNYAKYCMYAYDNYCAPLQVEPAGHWISNPIPIEDVTSYFNSAISWTEDVPVGTTLEASAIITATAAKTLVETVTEGNLALKKPVTLVTGTSSSNLAIATDGLTESASYVDVGSVLGKATLEIDLGDIASLTSIKIWHYYTDARTYKEKKLEVSEDGITWVTIYDQTVNGDYVEGVAGKEHILSPAVNARYIRDSMNGSTANASNHWVDIQAFGTMDIYDWVYPATESFVPITNGGTAPGVSIDDDLTGKFIWVKFDLSTTDDTKSPKVSELRVYLESYSLQNLLELDIEPTARFNNNEGDITIVYDQNIGVLQGEGGYVESFTRVFTPVELVSLPNPHRSSSTSIAASPAVNFIRIYYSQINGAKLSKGRYQPTSIKVTLTQVGVVNP